MRLMVFDRPVAPWRRCQAELTKDAVITGNASVDRHSRRVYIKVPAWIACLDLKNGIAWRK